MRLRLTIRRHGLPCVSILWNYSSILASGGNAATISQFLEQINGIIPLEADDWGLEDYVVENGAFECLHFSEVRDVLRDDDEVCIRPLQTNDLRARKLSGRHQISGDGKHLIDGVAFGRPRLRKAARPAIRIPSRKRLQYMDEWHDEDSPMESPEQLQNTKSKGRTRDAIIHLDSRDSVGYEDGSLEDELATLREDAMSIQPIAKRLRGNTNIEKTIETTSSSVTLGSRRKRRRLTNTAGDNPATPARLQIEDVARRISSLQPNRARRGSVGSNKSVHFDESGDPTPTTIRLELTSDDSDDEEDVDFEPTESDDSDKENAIPSQRAPTQKSKAKSNIQAQDSTSEDAVDSSEDEGYVPHEDNSLPSTIRRSRRARRSSSSSDSSASTSSSGTSDSESDSCSASDTSPSEYPIFNVNAIEKDQQISNQPSQAAEAPGTGMSKTQKRNQRKRNVKALNTMIAAGVLPAGSTLIALHAYRDRHRAADTMASTNEDEADHAPYAKARKMNGSPEARIAAAQVNEPDAEDIPAARSSKRKAAKHKKADLAAPILEDSTVNAALIQGTADDTGLHQSLDDSTAKADSETRRPKLDLASSKRLLFGSLGLRAPKTEEEAAKLQAKLMEKARRVPIKKAEEQGIYLNGDLDDSWQDKINVRAVECSYEGIEYSAPPFPFIQRWDPQQKPEYFESTPKPRKRKRKRNNTAVYENQYEDSFNDDLSQHKNQRRQSYEPPSGLSDFAEGSYNQSADQPVPDPNAVEDLPILSQDISSYEDMIIDDCVPGTVVAFKSLEMSLANGWQPCITDYRTAKIQKVLEDKSLVLEWAQRDRPADDRRYDSETGERVYGKFDMPGYDDEDGAEDVSKLMVPFAELLEPKIIRKAVAESKQNLAGEIQVAGTEHNTEQEDIHGTGLDAQARSQEQHGHCAADISTLRSVHSTQQPENFDMTNGNQSQELDGPQLELDSHLGVGSWDCEDPTYLTCAESSSHSNGLGISEPALETPSNDKSSALDSSSARTRSKTNKGPSPGFPDQIPSSIVQESQQSRDSMSTNAPSQEQGRTLSSKSGTQDNLSQQLANLTEVPKPKKKRSKKRRTVSEG